MVENIVAIELAYINTKHPDFYKDASSIGGMLKSPDMEADNRGQVRLTPLHSLNAWSYEGIVGQ